MASVVYNQFKMYVADGTIDLDTTVMYAALVMTNTSVDTENDGIENMDDWVGVGLDECDGSGYVRKILVSPDVILDDANDRARFDANDITWSALGNGTREVQGVIIYAGDISTDATNKVICYVEFASTVNPGGADLTVQWDSTGIMLLT